MEIASVFEIHELAQEFMNNPKIMKKGNNSVLMYDYETESGEYEWTGITFINTVKYRHVKEANIKDYMIKAYNRVVEIKNSNWKNEILSIDGEINNLKHYIVYFDGYGAYEFLSYGVIEGI
ncbi:hypothetical protein [Clostridium weizhouense]|uniref:Phage protein n=1 Tax=Clostridium weizhouense TaxID=2859781 RepID=A0ABS7ATE1_9CLOT|nr:hypothetical protein [Clostridium weizhouense]MBW6411914.1 hypothetical protein [Clostridium weizhouense]